MAYKWCVIINDRTGGSDREQDVTKHVRGFKFIPTAQGRPKNSTLNLGFPATTPDLNIQPDQEWWAGFRDTATRQWDSTRQIYGGYIGQSTGGAMAARHLFWLDLLEYDRDLPTTDIEIWPDPAALGVGYPDGYSLLDWLVGTAASGRPYDGLLPARLGSAGGIDLSGVDPVFDSVIFSRPPAGQMPGGGPAEHPAYGTWGYCPLDQPLDDLVAATRLLRPELDPLYYMEPVVDSSDPTKIRPRFRLVDRNDLGGTVVATYSTNPLPGEYRIENTGQTFKHARDARESYQAIRVKGAGMETGRIIAARVYRPDRPVTPTKYQTEPGRARVFVDEKIRSIALATAEATQLESYAWGHLGRIEVPVGHYAAPGSLIALKIPEEGFHGDVFRVYDVDDGWDAKKRPYWMLIVGAERPDLGNLFSRTTNRAVAIDELRQLGLPVPGAGVPHAISSTPVHSQQNVVKAQDDATVGLIIKPGYVPPGGTPSLTPAHSFQVHDALGVPKTYTTADGRPHPNAVHLGGFVTDGTFPGTFATYPILITAVDVEGGPGSVTLNKDSGSGPTAVAGPFTVGHNAISPPIAYNPRVGGTAADIMTVTWTGTSATPSYAVIWEA